jgi:hypothetical protein
MNVYTHVDSDPARVFSCVVIPSCVLGASVARRRIAKRQVESARKQEGYLPDRITADIFPDGHRRIEYVLEQEEYPPVRIIADFFSDGHEEFSERELGELVRWYPHQPSEQEHARAVELLLLSEELLLQSEGVIQ